MVGGKEEEITQIHGYCILFTDWREIRSFERRNLALSNRLLRPTLSPTPNYQNN